MDIAPTILHHFNLPIGKDMDGRVIGEMFKNTEKMKVNFYVNLLQL